MFLPNLFPGLIIGNLFDTVIPDFVLAFAFFTALTYAVLGRRFGQQRPAVAMSAALGMALAVGLVWWEYSKGFSIRNLGPIAVGFAIIMLAGVIYQSIRGVGGSWAGAGIALGASLLVGWAMGLDLPGDRAMLQSIITITLTVGILAFLLHRHGHVAQASFSSAWNEPAEVRHDMTDLDQDERIGRRLSHNLNHLKREARDLSRHPNEHPEEASDIMVQLRRILPAEGWLTERMARLREKAHHVRQGHIVKIQELESEISKLPAKARAKTSRELKARYKELNLDRRLERLDKAVAENELRIRNLTQQAQAYLNTNDYKSLAGILNVASKLQRHNAHLFKLIDGTEARLMSVAKQAALQSPR